MVCPVCTNINTAKYIKFCAQFQLAPSILSSSFSLPNGSFTIFVFLCVFFAEQAAASSMFRVFKINLPKNHRNKCRYPSFVCSRLTQTGNQQTTHPAQSIFTFLLYKHIYQHHEIQETWLLFKSKREVCGLVWYSMVDVL